MQRYFLELSYKGTAYCGWQVQPNALSIQEVIETEISKALNEQTPVTGCGRTDAGVHASQFFAHFESAAAIDTSHLAHKLNRMLPADIAIHRCFPVDPKLHARFDAVSRSYRYDMHFKKDPFRHETSYLFPFAEKCNWNLVRDTAGLLLNYHEFFPFCKSRSDVGHYRVSLSDAKWEVRHDTASFHISGNRFLRGMVRLIVGACLNTGLGQLNFTTIKQALDEQELISRSWSVPAEGLFLVKIDYPGF